MMHPKREGFDSATGSGQAELHPAGWDPMVESLDLLKTNAEILTRIAAALTNIAAERDAILPIPAGKSDGTIRANSTARFRAKFVVLCPTQSGSYVVQLGTEQFAFGTFSAPIVLPFPRVCQEGVDLFLFDSGAGTSAAHCTAYLIGTTE